MLIDYTPQVHEWPALLVAILFFGGLLMFFVGVLVVDDNDLAYIFMSVGFALVVVNAILTFAAWEQQRAFDEEAYPVVIEEAGYTDPLEAEEFWVADNADGETVTLLVERLEGDQWFVSEVER